MKIKLLFVFFILPTLIFSKTGGREELDPWYTGPLIAGSATNLKQKMTNIQYYQHIMNTYGMYHQTYAHSSRPDVLNFHEEFFIQYGILNDLNISGDFNFTYTHEGKENNFHMADTMMKLYFQLLRGKQNSVIPYINFTYCLVLPTGKYKNLNPEKNGIDASGGGSFSSNFGLNFQKLVRWFKNHPISFRLNLDYTYSPQVSVEGFNSYGGGYNTNREVSPGENYIIVFAFEYSLTQRWVLACDFTQMWNGKTTFTGTNGTNADGTAASNTANKSRRTTIAPAVEYNFSSNLGIIAGPNFSVAENNSVDFTDWLISVTYTF